MKQKKTILKTLDFTQNKLKNRKKITNIETLKKKKIKRSSNDDSLVHFMKKHGMDQTAIPVNQKSSGTKDDCQSKTPFGGKTFGKKKFLVVSGNKKC